MGLGMPSDQPEWYRRKRKQFEEQFQTMQVIPGSPDVIQSPSGHYALLIARYDHGPNTWAYSEGVVIPIHATSSTDFIARVQRNYGNFHHGWIEHENGHEYLLCGEDYQG